MNQNEASHQQWEKSFKSTLNRLSTQYLLLLRTASSELVLDQYQEQQEQQQQQQQQQKIDDTASPTPNSATSTTTAATNTTTTGNGTSSTTGSTTATATATTSSSSTNHIMDPRAGGGLMTSITEPPPPLAASTSISTLQTKLSTQNIIDASNTLLDLIRIMRMSALVMDGAEIEMEEELECCENDVVLNVVGNQARELEREWIELRAKEMELLLGRI
jgi:hypothetical protein